MPDLTLRLRTIADMVPEGAKVCDIGTDHGYLAIYLKANGKAESVIATDVNEKPLKRAKENITASGQEGISLRLCDGLEGLENGEADAVIIAGMGGEVIAGILERGKEFACDSSVTFIIQPTTSPEILRRFLCENGFSVLEEIPVAENGKVYSVMKCRFSGEISQKGEGFYYIGKVTPETQAGALYIEKQKKRLRECINALENNESKRELYLEYKRIFEEIVAYSEN